MADTLYLYYRKCPKANSGSVCFRTVMHQALGKKGVHQAGNIMAILVCDELGKYSCPA